MSTTSAYIWLGLKYVAGVFLAAFVNKWGHWCEVVALAAILQHFAGQLRGAGITPVQAWNPRKKLLEKPLPMARILIVEDEAIIAWEISRKLQQAGHTVVGIADSAEQALVTVQQHKPNFDLVLMDINLQGKQDGLAVAQEINNLLMLPILFVSGELNPEIEAQVAAVPHWSYLSKPFSTLVLQSTVGMILDQG